MSAFFRKQNFKTIIYCVGLLFYIPSIYATSFNKVCRPLQKPATAQFIIGYGSLIQEQSKRKASNNVGENIPILVTGYERGWIVHGQRIPGGKTTFLGVTPKKNSKMNAVYFKLNQANDLAKYDARERTYCRKEVLRPQLQSIISNPLPKGQYWIYTSLTSNQRPSSQYPIFKSYLNIFLSGCMQIEKKYHLHDYKNMCVSSTKYWP